MSDPTMIIISHEGELNVASSQPFKTRLLEAAAPAIIVDLSAVPFIDSSGLGALIAALKAATARGDQLVLAGLQAQAATVFRITQADRLFTIFPTVDDARATLGGSAG